MEAVKEEMAVQKREPINIDITRGITPHSYQELLQFAALYKNSGLAPKSFQTVEQLAIAIGMCLELDRPILTGLQDMAVINGRVGVYGDATLAIIRASGLLEEFEQWEEGKPYTDEWIVYTKVKRQGMKEKTDYWSWPDSKRAGFDHPKLSQSKGGGDDKFSPWTRFTRRMMYFKSRNFLLRDEFGDVLKGMNTVEELQEIIDVTPEPIPTLKIEGKAEPDASQEGTDPYKIKSGGPEPEKVKSGVEEPGTTPPPEQPISTPSKSENSQGEASSQGSEGEKSLFETLKGARPSASAKALADWKILIEEKADEIREFPAEEYQYIAKKWNKACPGQPFPARPLTQDETKDPEYEAPGEEPPPIGDDPDLSPDPVQVKIDEILSTLERNDRGFIASWSFSTLCKELAKKIDNYHEVLGYDDSTDVPMDKREQKAIELIKANIG